MYTNADSLLNKRDELLAAIAKEEYDIISISEIKPKTHKDVNLTEYQLPGYEMFLNKDIKRGVALYVKKDINPQEVSTLNDHNFQESIWCKVERGGQSLLLGTVYRSPNSSDENDFNLFNLMNDNEIIQKKYNKICIMGDFNFPSINWTNRALSEGKKGCKFQESIDDSLLFQMVENSTRHRHGQSSNLLDLVIVNDEEFISNIEHSSPLGNSDHDVLSFTLYMPYSPPKESFIKVFNMKRGNFAAMREEFANHKWNLQEKNPNEICNTIKEVIRESMDRNIPKVKQSKKRYQPKWLDNKTLRKIKKKHRLFKRFLITKEGIDYLRFIEARRKCKRAIKTAKREYEKKIAKHSKHNPRQFWNFVNDKLKVNSNISPLDKKDGSKATSDEDKANVLNEYFASVFTKENLNNIPDYTPHSVNICDIRVTPTAVQKKLSKLDPSKAQGPDKIPSRILKELSNELAQPISFLFNATLETGQLPEDWKKAEVIAIYKKKGKKSDPANYRPVSLTCILCKVLEDIIRDCIVDHMNNQNIYSPSQHGFRKQMSCMTQLLEVMNDFTKMIENGSDIDVIYLDFKKAFDSVPHVRLLNKLSAYGIQGEILNWIRSFLTNRQQKVRVGGAISTPEPVVSGIPQGSILGPILFTIFINDLPDNIESKCKIFADDTKIYNDPGNANILQDDLSKLQTWSEKWQLGFNITKCKVLHIGKKNPEVTYSMVNNETPQEVTTCEEEKDLGVTFDKKLDFSSHIDKAINTAKRVLSMTKRAFKHLDKDSLLTIYKSLIRPHLEYGNLIWSPRLKKHSIALEKIQRKATKLIPDLREEPYHHRLKVLNLPSLKHRRRRGDLIETFKILNGFVKVNNIFILANNVTRTNSKKIYIQHCKKEIRKNYLPTRTARYWNALNHNTVNALTTNQFKNLLDEDPNFNTLKYDYDE